MLNLSPVEMRKQYVKVYNFKLSFSRWKVIMKNNDTIQYLQDYKK